AIAATDGQDPVGIGLPWTDHGAAGPAQQPCDRHVAHPAQVAAAEGQAREMDVDVEVNVRPGHRRGAGDAEVSLDVEGAACGRDVSAAVAWGGGGEVRGTAAEPERRGSLDGERSQAGPAAGQVHSPGGHVERPGVVERPGDEGGAGARRLEEGTGVVEPG